MTANITRRSFTIVVTTDVHSSSALAGYGTFGGSTMPTAAQVKALIRSHADGDEERFYSIALQVAAQAARQGHGRFAQELREVIDHGRTQASKITPGQRVRPMQMVQPRGELAGLLTAAYPKTRLSELVLSATVKRRIERVLTE